MKWLKAFDESIALPLKIHSHDTAGVGISMTLNYFVSIETVLLQA